MKYLVAIVGDDSVILEVGQNISFVMLLRNKVIELIHPNLDF
tara:strand:+ start:500 stop:625 length:126 start_codon:yes stop_codon:yes gene_type:complete